MGSAVSARNHMMANVHRATCSSERAAVNVERATNTAGLHCTQFTSTDADSQQMADPLTASRILSPHSPSHVEPSQPLACGAVGRSTFDLRRVRWATALGP